MRGDTIYASREEIGNAQCAVFSDNHFARFMAESHLVQAARAGSEAAYQLLGIVRECRRSLRAVSDRPDDSIPEWRGWHAFRRGIASSLTSLGVKTEFIQRVLRHANISTTREHYIKMSPQDIQREIDKLRAELERREATGVVVAKSGSEAPVN
jgi:hypothetical protein